jgi:hypothetical protein
MPFKINLTSFVALIFTPLFISKVTHGFPAVSHARCNAVFFFYQTQIY